MSLRGTHCALFFTALGLSTAIALAAPIPGTSTSILVSENPQLFRSSHGFQLHAADTSWSVSTAQTSSKNLEAIYKSPKLSQGLQASLTVRIDQRKPRIGFKQYLKRSIKDYARLGMDVLKARPVKINDSTGFLIDAVGQNKEKQLRQIIFGKGRTMVILTCRDHKKNFRSSVKECNEIFKTFSWL